MESQRPISAGNGSSRVKITHEPRGRRRPLTSVGNNMMSRSMSMDFTSRPKTGPGPGFQIAKRVAGGDKEVRKEDVAIMLSWLGSIGKEGVLIGLRALQVLLREAKWRECVVTTHKDVIDLMKRSIIDGVDKSSVIVACNAFSNLSHEASMEVPTGGFVHSVVEKLVQGGGRDSKITQSLLQVIQGMVGSEVRRRAFWAELIKEGVDKRHNTTNLFCMLAATTCHRDEKVKLRALGVLVNLTNEQFGKEMTSKFDEGAILNSTFELLSAVPNKDVVVLSLRLLVNVGSKEHQTEPRLLNKAVDLLSSGDVQIASLSAEVLLIYGRCGGGRDGADQYHSAISDLIVCGLINNCLLST